MSRAPGEEADFPKEVKWLAGEKRPGLGRSPLSWCDVISTRPEKSVAGITHQWADICAIYSHLGECVRVAVRNIHFCFRVHRE